MKEKPNAGQTGVPGIGDMPFDIVDARQAVLNGKGPRNLVEVFDFDPGRDTSEFGEGNARVIGVKFLDAEGKPVAYIAGGEAVDLVIDVMAMSELRSPIVGFYVKDRLGQQLFGDNTYLSCLDQRIQLESGARLQAHFRFRMPILAPGDYSIDAAVATGTQIDHTQQHWLRDALVFKAGESSMRHGLIGIPMHEIAVERVV